MATRNLNLHYLGERAGRFTVTRAQLERLLDAELRDRSPAALADYATDAPPVDRVTFSFDDAHRSVLDAADLLAARGIRATLFVPVGWIDEGSRWMSWDELRRFRDLGHTIGSHGMRHPRMSWALYREDAEAHGRRLEDECARSRELLEKKLGVACELFAYPYGEDPARAREAVRRAGYRAAFTVRDEGDWDGDRLSIPRVCAMEVLREKKPGAPVGISVVVPIRDRREMLREIVERLVDSSYPVEAHEILVVDDGSATNPRSVFGALPDHVRFVRAAEPGGPFRAGQARNAGAEAAKHPYLAFLDSDVVVGRDFLWALDWVHQRTRDAAVCGYLSGYNLHERGFAHRLEDVRGRTPLESLPVIPDRSREPAARECLDNVEWLEEPWRLCYTGNLSLPKALFDRIGGFSDRFTGWGLEDIDLGYRLHRAGATFVFSRFALGYHLVDPDEDAPRNPFRKDAPVRVDFERYLGNVAILESLHAGDEAVKRFAERARADVDEICGRPSTVGIEFGGASSRRAPFHREMHRVAIGGVPTEELLDRVAYAKKVGAKSLWLLGGEPAEHEGFFAVLEAATEAGLRVGMQSQGHAFARAGLAERAARTKLGHVTIVFAGATPDAHDALFGAGASAEHAAGVAALRAAGIHVSARVIVDAVAAAGALGARVAELEAAGITIDEIAVAPGIDPADVGALGRAAVPLLP